MSILDEILALKRAEVLRAKEAVPQNVLEAAGETRGFLRCLRANDGPALIAEVKKASPSKGVIRKDFDPVAIARAYERGGAACLSVLTDEPFFQGNLDYLRAIRQAVGLPLLRKDFTIDPYQVYEARAAGADAILLIVAAFEEAAPLRDLLELARSLSMDVLVEVHDERQMGVAVGLGADLIGINNRDLHTFETSLSVTERLAGLAPADAILVSESGIRTAADARRAKAAGCRAVLVGESLMREQDVEEATRRLLAI